LLDAQAKLKDATADAAKWKDACLRAVADTENQRRIAKEDVAKARSFGMQSMFADMPMLRQCCRGFQAMMTDSDDDSSLQASRRRC